MKDRQAKIAYKRSMYWPQEFQNPFTAEKVMAETALTGLCYGYGASRKLLVYDDEAEFTINPRQLYEDAISLAMGIHEIKLPHLDTCNRLICNCKIH